MARTGHDGDEFVALVKRRNATIMDGRPGRSPGDFKTRANRAGDPCFVEPVLVAGTLRARYRLRGDLDTAASAPCAPLSSLPSRTPSTTATGAPHGS